MPWIQVQEGCNVVETEGGGDGDDDDAYSVAGEERGDEIASSRVRVEFGGVRIRECPNDQEDREDDEIQLDEGEDDERPDITVPRSGECQLEIWNVKCGILPFRSVSECENELQPEASKVYVLHHGIEDGGDVGGERKRGIIIEVAWNPDQVHDDGCGQPERRWAQQSANVVPMTILNRLPKENHARTTVAIL